MSSGTAINAMMMEYHNARLTLCPDHQYDCSKLNNFAEALCCGFERLGPKYVNLENKLKQLRKTAMSNMEEAFSTMMCNIKNKDNMLECNGIIDKRQANYFISCFQNFKYLDNKLLIFVKEFKVLCSFL